MIAAMNGHKDTILMLIQKGANLNLVNQVSMYLFVKVKFYYYCFVKYQHYLTYYCDESRSNF